MSALVLQCIDLQSTSIPGLVSMETRVRTRDKAIKRRCIWRALRKALAIEALLLSQSRIHQGELQKMSLTVPLRLLDLLRHHLLSELPLGQPDYSSVSTRFLMGPFTWRLLGTVLRLHHTSVLAYDAD